MCGIAGYWSARDGADAATVRAMADRLSHRGPDDAGVWVDAGHGVALGHRRLSIQDLSAAGHQPMVSPGGRWVITFNGEVYNNPALRRELEAAGEAPAWRGHSDTETLLAAFDRWGVAATLNKVVGMFAFAVWDRQTATLTLARDRFGEKPLYYGWQGETFLFGSELKALRAHAAFAGEIDRAAVALFLRHGYVPTPRSIYRGVAKLPPGTLIEIARNRHDATPATWWSAGSVAASGLADPFRGSADDAVAELDRLLSDAVGGQMISDVPLGAFLSGGIDSSLIAALMQRHSGGKAKTFSIGFEDADYDEARHAKAVARHLATDHTELYVTARDALEVIPRLPAVYDEPFADASQIPTVLLAAMARRDVTVSLSGDAGDEVFGGYDRYAMVERVWPRLAHIPRPVRRTMGAAATAVPARAWQAVARRSKRLFPPSFPNVGGNRVHKLADLVASADADDLYRRFVTHWAAAETVVIGAGTCLPSSLPPPWREAPTLAERFMALDAASYLPDDILVKVDRAAMATGLETRAPYLDHRVFGFASRLPLTMKWLDGKPKGILRRLLARYVPEELIERPKMGFNVPMKAWLRGPLRNWGEDLLSRERLLREGFLDPAPIRRKWEQHQSGTRNWHQDLWDVLMFQAWNAERQTA